MLSCSVLEMHLTLVILTQHTVLSIYAENRRVFFCSRKIRQLQILARESRAERAQAQYPLRLREQPIDLVSGQRRHRAHLVSLRGPTGPSPLAGLPVRGPRAPVPAKPGRPSSEKTCSRKNCWTLLNSAFTRRFQKCLIECSWFSKLIG